MYTIKTNSAVLDQLVDAAAKICLDILVNMKKNKINNHMAEKVDSKTPLLSNKIICP